MRRQPEPVRGQSVLSGRDVREDEGDGDGVEGEVLSGIEACERHGGGSIGEVSGGGGEVKNRVCV
jgi:hypothetical protein